MITEIDKSKFEKLLDELFDPNPIVIDDNELDRRMNRTARKDGFSYQDFDDYSIRTLSCQERLDDYMKCAVTQINTYELGGQI